MCESFCDRIVNDGVDALTERLDYVGHVKIGFGSTFGFNLGVVIVLACAHSGFVLVESRFVEMPIVAVERAVVVVRVVVLELVQ